MGVFHRCGDEIVEINESPVHCMTLNEVYTILSHCDPGPVPITVSRHPDPQVTCRRAFLCPGSLFQYESQDKNRMEAGMSLARV